MNEKRYPRRGLIKTGLALIAGVLAFGGSRVSLAGTKTNKNNRWAGRKVDPLHCLEGDSITKQG